MSWTECFPIFTDEMLEYYGTHCSPDQRAELENWFGVDHVDNARPEAAHVVATSLFWKQDSLWQEDLSDITLEKMMNPGAYGVNSRYPPWNHYVRPLLEGAALLEEQRPDAVIRVYLANDLHFLIEALVDAGCEVVVMRSSSIRHNPGAMWRFLALEDSRPVSIIDSDRGPKILGDIARTEAARTAGIGGWRAPYCFGYEGGMSGRECYRPMTACQFGSLVSHPMQELLRAFVWMSLMGMMPNTCRASLGREQPIIATTWPDYGFDEWFLLAVMYPRMAAEGLLTFFPWDMPSPSQFFALDIEYVTWLNPTSELVFFDNPPSVGPPAGL